MTVKKYYFQFCYTEDELLKQSFFQENVIFNQATKITSLVVFNPELPWRCTFYKTFFLAFNSLIFMLAVFISVYLLNNGFKYYKRQEQKSKEEIGFMVERIIDILQSSVSEDGADNYVVINHVRDMILPVTERKSK